MTTAATGPAFAHAQPAQIRAALGEQDQARFDAAYQYALATAAVELDLGELQRTLAIWRRVARLTSFDPQGYRRMLEQAEQLQRTGEVPAGSVSWRRLPQLPA